MVLVRTLKWGIVAKELMSAFDVNDVIVTYNVSTAMRVSVIVT